MKNTLFMTILLAASTACLTSDDQATQPVTGTTESDLSVITLQCRGDSQDMRLCKQCNAGGVYDCCAGYDVCQAACEHGHATDKKGQIIIDQCNAP